MQLLAHLDIGREARQPFVGEAPEERFHEQLVPALGEMRLVHQRHDVGLFEPHLAVPVHRQVVRLRSQRNAARRGRRTGDRVDEYPQLDGLADRLNEFEIELFGIGFARIAVVDVAI